MDEMNTGAAIKSCSFVSAFQATDPVMKSTYVGAAPSLRASISARAENTADETSAASEAEKGNWRNMVEFRIPGSCGYKGRNMLEIEPQVPTGFPGRH